MGGFLERWQAWDEQQREFAEIEQNEEAQAGLADAGLIPEAAIHDTSVTLSQAFILRTSDAGKFGSDAIEETLIRDFGIHKKPFRKEKF